ncbi:tryptophan synthase beta subunit-like PLP-dependent enzyme [Exophiala viscosa]|uniref:tryptophan synthase beta subunit-like PLP-dependent enzyme n=1 Tax=Exophiala viscosa TaxID=2486360 RepID=UPI002198AB63|nr:tryptophan synthase beta subunit-like PLP-dependent enzyme [Exophiala viscosa]
MVILPEPFSSIPRTQLMYPGPTHISRLDRLTSKYGDAHNIGIWVKHEETNSPLAMGGNKIRKLEYLVPEIKASDCDTLVTVGGIQSNHCRQVAAIGAKFGYKVVTVQDDRVHPPNETYYELGNVQLSRVMGCESRQDHSVEEVMDQIRAQGGKPYFIPSGMSLHPLGGLGFARWAFEVVEQERELGVRFDAVVVSVNSGSTVAGMIAGFKMADVDTNKKRKIVCVDASSRPKEEVQNMVLKIARTTAARIGLAEDEIGEDDVLVEDRFTGSQYGKPEKATVDAVRVAAEMEALILDPVYTGKAFAGLLGLLEQNEIQPGSNVLFCHTGGQSVLGAYGEI